MPRPRTRPPKPWSLTAAVSVAALTAFAPSLTTVTALSSHSPQDLFAFPKFEVVFSEQGVLNETVPSLLAEAKELSASAIGPTPTVHLLRALTGQAWLCTVPAVEEDESPPKQPEELSAASIQRRREAGLERGLELIEGMRGSCLYQKQGWFTYSFCYGDQIRQFHEVRIAGTAGPSEDPNTEAYTLGQAPAPVASLAVPKYGSGSGLVTKKGEKLRIPSTLGGGIEVGLGWDDGGRYLSQRWEMGTACDKTGLPRTVEVQFHCSTQSTDRIALIRETSICNYVMLIHTPRLCAEPIFLEGNPRVQEPGAIIQCQPVVKRLRDSVDPASAPAASQPPPVAKPESAAKEGEGAPANSGIDGFDDLDDDDGGEVVEQEVLTVMYDPETGELHAAETEGEQLFIDTATGEIKNSRGGRYEVSTQRNDAAKIDELTDMAKIMKQSIEDVLHGAAGRGAREGRGANVEQPVVAENGIVFEGIEGLLEAVQRGIKAKEVDSSDNGAQKEKKQAVELDEYLKSIEVALKKTGVLSRLTESLNAEVRRKRRPHVGGAAQPEIFESEEHSKLAKLFKRSYEDEEEEGERKRAPAQVERAHDEL